MSYIICRNANDYFPPREVKLGKPYRTFMMDNVMCFRDEEGDIRKLRNLLTNPLYGVWVRCDFSIYLGLLK